MCLLIQRFTRALALAVLAASTLSPLRHGWKTPLRPFRPYGRYPASRILERAAPLCRAIAPDADGLYLSIRPGLPEEALLHLWYVVGTDRGGRDVLSLYWDADTGEIWRVERYRAPERAGQQGSPPERAASAARAERAQARRQGSRWVVDVPKAIGTLTPPDGTPDVPLLDRWQAVRAAWNWLCVLGIAGHASRWQVARPPERGNRFWSMCWRAVCPGDSKGEAGRTVWITLDARTGALATAQNGRLPKNLGESNSDGSARAHGSRWQRLHANRAEREP